jgi:hypothetical protein
VRLSPHPAQACPPGPLARRSTIRSTEAGSSAGPLTTIVVAASRLSIGSGLVVSFSGWAHLTTSARFRARAPDPVSGQLSTTISWRRWPGSHGSRCLSAAGVRFLVILRPPGSWALLTVGLPANGRTQTGFPCFTRTSCDRGGCPLYSGDNGAHPDRSRSPASVRRFSTAQSLHPATTIHPCGAPLDEASTKGSNDFTRPIFPSPVATGWNSSVLGLNPELRTPPSRATHVGVGTGHRART